MGYIEFNSKSQFPQENSNVFNEYWFESTDSNTQILIDRLKEVSLISDNRICYAFGYGKHPKSTYQAIKNHYGITLLWNRFNGPFWLKPLSGIIAGQSGLIRINEQSQVEYIIKELSHLSMVGVFSVSKAFEHEFELFLNSQKKNYSIRPEEYVKKDPTFFSVIIDGDNVEVPDNDLIIISCGKYSPDDLKQVVFEFGKYGRY